MTSGFFTLNPSFLYPKRVPKRGNREEGISLIVALLMLVAVSMLGISATQIALQGEKASRADRDRQIAMQAAEAALMDAELDIRKSPDATLSRSEKFSEKPLLEDFIVGCGTSSAGKSWGLCRVSDNIDDPVWLHVDLTDTTANAKSVPYGKFTGQTMAVGSSMLPSQLPRYIIEAVPYKAAGANADEPASSYRITAIGFGVKPATQVVLQAFYVKVDE